MTAYALVGLNNVVDRIDLNIAIADAFCKPGWRWLVYERVDPPYNPATEIKTGPVRVVLIDRVQDVWTVRTRTAEEIAAAADAEKEFAIDQLGAAFKVLFNHENRVRALEGKAAITALQFRTAVKALL